MIGNSKWDEIDNKVKSLSDITRNRRNKHISSTQPTYSISKMHDRRTSNTTTGHIQRNKKQNIRQIPVFPVHTKPRRITRTISLHSQTKSSTLQLGRSRRQLSKKHLHTRNGKSTDPNESISRRGRSTTDLTLRNNKREGSRKSTTHQQHSRKKSRWVMN